jgi:endonuclease/exonuclease/phosphatase (EEP) superfamily protein YafD
LAVLLLVLAAVWALKRRWQSAAVCGVFAAINALLVLSLLWPIARTVVPSGAPLRLVAINVHTANERADLVLDFLRSAHTDVILLMEVNERWMSDLSPLHNSHPHVVAEPREDNFGIALFSRIPLTNDAVIELGDAGVPSITAQIRVGAQKLTVLGTHPLPPGSSEYARLRNGQLREIATQVRAQSGPVIVLGDLNVTPWSPYFADLLRDSGLKNTSQGRGLYGSWPAWLPVGRIPLDHCLASPSIGVINKQLGPSVGGDHLPIVIGLQVPTNN